MCSILRTLSELILFIILRTDVASRHKPLATGLYEQILPVYDSLWRAREQLHSSIEDEDLQEVYGAVTILTENYMRLHVTLQCVVSAYL